MADRLDLACLVCGHVGLDDGSDGYFYCQRCGSQAEDIRDTADDHEELFEGRQASQVRRTIKPVDTIRKSVTESQTQSQFWDSLRTLEDDFDAGNCVGPTGPSDFGSGLRTLSYEDYYSEIRLKYVMGVQIMIQLQCKALVEKFQVSPLIVGMAGTLWLRFVALTRIFSDGWADEAINESESQKEGHLDPSDPSYFYDEPHNMLGQRAVMIWYRSLNKTIPLSYSLVISFLVCHLAREAILPTDIIKWALEGKLPYFSAFVQIEKQIGPHSTACPISSSRMFRPAHVISAQKLESLAASVANTVGLELPPVNFYVIASRYLMQLSLPMEKILPHACRIYEWSMPPELWLSANELRLPTRACVMSILIVSIRILYNINGLGEWETILLSGSRGQLLMEQDGETEPTCSTDMKDADTSELLLSLETKFNELNDNYEYSKDLPTYLQYCKDVVFAGLEPSLEDHEEQKIIEDLWDFYQKRKGSDPSDDRDVGSFERSGDHKRSREHVIITPKESKKLKDTGCTSNNQLEDSMCNGNDSSQHSFSCRNENPTFDGKTYVESHKDRAIRRLRSNMEENRFCYIEPRVNVKKRNDYLHYMRKKDEGAYTYAAHADYYILLRSCAKVAQLDIRNMHVGVLSFERRLGWLEKRIDHCLKVKPPNDTCDFCSSDVENDSMLCRS
ncbi:hypothetical protein LguiA_033917 [Lonicera macranthoides]